MCQAFVACIGCPDLTNQMGPYYIYTRLPSRCYMLLARPGQKVNLVAQSREWKINMAGVETSEENDSSEELVPKKNCTSEIWQYFGFKREDASQMQVLCKSCRKTVVTSRGNTTNLHSHLEHNHREIYEDFQKCKAKSTKTANEKPSNNKGVVQTTIDQSFTNATPYGKTSKRHKELTDAITRFLAKDMMPVKTVSKGGFVGLINKLDRRYQLPSRNYFSHVAIPQMYDTCVKTVSSVLRQVDFYASTTDLWSSRTTEPYVSYTVHVLTQDFELKTRCLGVVYFPESHTSENIAHGLWDVLASWNLKEENQVSITTEPMWWRLPNLIIGSGYNALDTTCIWPSVSVECLYLQ